MFSEIEQEEIINEFLKKIEEKEANIVDDFLNHSEPEDEEDEYSRGFVTEERFKQESEEHNKMIETIETKNYVPMKNAMIQYMKQTDNHYVLNYAKNYSYGKDRSSWWWFVLHHWEKVIEVKKNGNRWVCSKEKLDVVDFKILERYRNYKRRFD